MAINKKINKLNKYNVYIKINKVICEIKAPKCPIIVSIMYFSNFF